MPPQTEWFEKDYYKTLGVSQSADEKEITRAYRKLAKKYHPDANPGSEDRFKEISAAYDVLSDPQRRKEYDQVRAMGPLGAGMRAGPGAQQGGFSFHVEDISDLLGGLFGRGRGTGRGAGAQRGGGPQRGVDLEAELHLGFEEAVEGATTTVSVNGDAACRTCGGSGAAPGTSPVICARCGGRGVLDDNQGLFSFSHPCPDCGGRGLQVKTPCPTCAGSGVERRTRQVRVRIPAGVEDGQKIRLKGRGGPGRNGGPPGDLYVTVRVQPHRLFGRRGRDLTITAPVTFAEAALGATITVPTLHGPVSLKVPPGTPSGKTLRVRGRGVPASDGRSGTGRGARTEGPGDLLVTIEVDVPRQLSPEQHDAVEALAKTYGGATPRDGWRL